MGTTMTTTPHRVRYERDDDRWFVDALDVPGAHTEARTLAAAREAIREAIAVVLDLPEGAEDTIELDEEYALPPLGDIAAAARDLRAHAATLEELAQQVTADVVALARKLADGHPLSDRDIAAMLGVSHQRVHQLRAAGAESAESNVLAEHASRVLTEAGLEAQALAERILGAGWLRSPGAPEADQDCEPGPAHAQ